MASPAWTQDRFVRPLITEPVDETKLTVLAGNTHPLARPELDRGEAPASLPMERMLLVLKRSPEQEAALQRLMDEQLDRTSPNFHQWLTPEQFGQRFGPSSQDLQAVTSWLASHGFDVARVSNGRTAVEFSGRAAQVEEAFHASIHKYFVDGKEHWANASDPSIPAALAPAVTGIVSLNNFALPRMLTFPAPCNGSGIRPSGNCYFVGPFDFAAIYNVLPLWNAGIDGTGQTIGIVAASDIHIQDVRNFRSLFGLPSNDPVVIFNGTNPGFVNTPQPDGTEATTDVEWAGAVAKGAKILLIVSKATNSTPGQELSAEYIVDHNLAPVLGASYGGCELALGTAGNQFHNQLWQQAAAQGITVLVGAGDNGSAGCDSFRATPPSPAQSGLAVSGVASTPFNVAVGGTAFNDLTNAASFWNSTSDPTTKASAKAYIPETAWNDSCTNSLFASLLGFSMDPESNCNNPQLSTRVRVSGGSGGKSSCIASNGQTCTAGYPKPSWQTGPGVPNDGARDVPDLAVFSGSGLTGAYYAFCEADLNSDGSTACDLNFPNPNVVSGHLQGAAGTSESAPAFAGIVALAVQKTGSRQGNINPLLYQLAAQQTLASCNSSSPASSCVFNDVTVGSIAVPCKKGTSECIVANPVDSIGVLSGYAAGPGFDFATGLGSVNAFNLINASGWTSNTSPDFALSSANATVTVASPGSSGTLTLNVTSVNGFSGTFNLSAASCFSLPAGASCSFSPSSVTLGPATLAAPVTITIVTTAPSLTVPLSLRDIPSVWAPTLILLGCFVTGLAWSLRANRRWSAAAFVSLFASVLIYAAACGGGSLSVGSGGGGGNPGTPTGTTNAVVVLSSGATTHSFVFTLNVM